MLSQRSSQHHPSPFLLPFFAGALTKLGKKLKCHHISVCNTLLYNYISNYRICRISHRRYEKKRTTKGIRKTKRGRGRDDELSPIC